MMVKKLFVFLFRGALLLFQLALLLVVLYRVLPVPITPLMLLRGGTIHKEWKPLHKISKQVPIAVFTSEDPNFLNHKGFDLEAIQKVLKDKQKKENTRLRGASTVSQQTAKNVFLWPARSWLRKGLEVPLTLGIELFWTKRRIMEVYLNVIEMGSNVYGIEAAAQHYFKKSAQDLSRKEAAAIVSCFPNPRIYIANKPSRYIKKKQKRISRWMIGYDPVPEWWYGEN
jgi:monofunctional biosynthetic peptidoglycan transglycosylase